MSSYFHYLPLLNVVYSIRISNGAETMGYDNCSLCLHLLQSIDRLLDYLWYVNLKVKLHVLEISRFSEHLNNFDTELLYYYY
jgi:hypothetical protein